MSRVTTFQKFTDAEISEEVIQQAAELFSSNYGVWGPYAQERNSNSQIEGEF